MTNTFDLDLKRGQISEQLVKSILTQDVKIEVKTDFLVSKTGNVAIEFECRGKPSGIKTTTADWWVIVLEGKQYDSEVAIMIRTKRLFNLCKKYAAHTVKGGDDMLSRMVLIPVKELAQPHDYGYRKIE